MTIDERVATWLDMAAAAQGPGTPEPCARPRVRAHPVGGHQGGCFALSLDGHWLCDNAGSITVFRGMAPMLRFLSLLQVQGFEAGEPAPQPVACGDAARCLGLRGGRGLAGCPRARVKASRGT